MSNEYQVRRSLRSSLAAVSILGTVSVPVTAADIQWNIASCGTNAFSAGHCWVGNAVPDTNDNAVFSSGDSTLRSIRFNTTTLNAWNSATGNALGAITNTNLDVLDGNWQMRAAPGQGPYDYALTGEITINGGTMEFGDLTGSPLDISVANHLRVGRDTVGGLTIHGGSTVTNGQGIIGELGNGNGDVTVSGAGTIWSNSALDVGRLGSANLSIEAGAQVNSGTTFVSRQTNSAATVSVTGNGSQWDVSGPLSIGRSNFGSGAVEVVSGGTLNSGATNIAHNTGAGSGAVTVGDSVGTSTWSNATTLNVGGDNVSAGGTGSLTVNAGGVVINGGAMTVWGPGSVDTSGGGVLRTDSLMVNGGSVNAGSSIVDQSLQTTASGQVLAATASIAGAGSQWNNSGSMVVGRTTTGALQITNGATVNNAQGIIGGLSGSDGAVTVSGASTSWTNAGLDVGRLGTASLDINSGASVSSATSFVSRQTNSTANVTISGTGSQWDVSGPLSIGRSNFGSGTVEVLSGGALTSASSNISNNTGGGSGTVVVGDGVGTSSWTNATTLNVGGDDVSAGGSASLTVNDGGVVNNGGILRIWDDGLLKLDGGTITTESFDVSLGGFDFRDGTLHVQGGTYATAASNTGFLSVNGPCGGDCSGNARTLTLDGVTPIVLSGDLDVMGDTLTFVPTAETLNLIGGTVVTSAGGDISGIGGPSAQATLNVDGAGSGWDALDDVTVGNFGNGTLRVANAGQVHVSDELAIASAGKLDLAGGDVFADTVDLQGRVEGFGTLAGRISGSTQSAIVADGGTLNIGDGSRFDAVNIAGSTTVESGATLNLISQANFNRLGPVTQLNGGVVTSNTGVVLDAGRVINGSGEVDTRIAALAGSSIVATGTLALGKHDAFDGFFSDGALQVGNHEVTINDRDEAVLGSFTELGNSSGAGTLIATNGLLVEFGKTIAGHGVVQGDILNNGLIHGEGPGVFDFLDLQGVVNGVGDFSGTVQFSGGFTPGLSPTITNGENLIFNSFLEIELGGLVPGSEHDQIDATGFVLIGGDLEITLINSWAPSLGDAYTIIMAEQIVSAGGAPPAFSSVSFPELSEGLRFVLDFDLDENGHDELVVRVAAVPLPGAVWFAMTGLLVLLRNRRQAV